MPGIYHHAGCCCHGPCPCLGDEPTLTVERVGTCPDGDDLGGLWFDQIDYWEVWLPFGNPGDLLYPWCELTWIGYQGGDPPVPIGWLHLAYNRQTSHWCAWLDVPGAGTAGMDADTCTGGWGASPCTSTDVSGLVECDAEAITGTFDLAGDADCGAGGLEGCTFSCVIG